jgi:hypothetical protein
VDDVASVVDVAVVLLVVSDAFQEAPQPVRIGITCKRYQDKKHSGANGSVSHRVFSFFVPGRWMRGVSFGRAQRDGQMPNSSNRSEPELRIAAMF